MSAASPEHSSGSGGAQTDAGPEEPITLAAPVGTTLPPPVRPRVRRMSRNLGIAVFAMIALLVGAIVFGIAERQRAAQSQDGRGSIGPAPRAAPATAAAGAITQGLPSAAFLRDGRSATDERAQAGANIEGEGQAVRTASGLVVPGGSSSTPAGAAAAAPQPLTPEERALERAYLDEIKAIEAGTGAGARPAAIATSAAATAGGPLLPPELLAAVGALSGNRPATPDGPAMEAADEMAQQNGWARKRGFGGAGRPGAWQPPSGPYLIRAGWTIPAILEQDLNSDLPGEIRALVTQNVYDTATGAHLLIPQGTRLVGTYDSAVGYGQGALQAVWTTLVFPDASVLELGAARAQDASGRAGLRFRTDYHTGRLVGAALLTSLFSAGYEIAQGNRRGTLLEGSSAADRAARGAAEEISRLGTEITRRNLNIAPTIEIPAGFRLQVFVAQDLRLPGAYGEKMSGG